MELKEQIKQELLQKKEKELAAEKKINAGLKEITLYTKEKNPMCEQFKKTYTDVGIKFIEKPLDKSVIAITGNQAVPIIHVNDNWLVQGRDFMNTKQSIAVLRHVADPEYVNPPFETRMLEALKNLSMNIHKSMTGLNRQLKPVIDVMQGITKEIQEEKKPGVNTLPKGKRAFPKDKKGA
jgi:hypothetical protein